MVAKQDVLGLPLPTDSDSVELILKLPGESCNLNCTYCYEKRQPDPSDGRIDAELLRSALNKFEDNKVSIGLHGGEPLLIGKSKMAELLRTIETFKNITSIKLQTNGALMDKEWVELLSASRIPVTIGVSHDGPKSLSENRISYSGKPTDAKTERALDLLERAKINFGVITVVSKSNIGHPRDLLSFFSRYKYCSTVNFVPCFDYKVISRSNTGNSGLVISRLNPEGRDLPDWAITPLEFYDFLMKLWRAWEKEPNFVIEPFSSIIRSIAGVQPDSCDFTDKKCGHVLTLYPDGRLTSCDEFESSISNLDFNFTTESTEEVWSRVNFGRVVDEHQKVREKCVGCSHETTCNGGCIATRGRYFGTKYYEDYCDYKMGIIDFVAERIG